MQTLSSRRAALGGAVRPRSSFVAGRPAQQQRRASHIARVAEIEGEAMFEQEVLKVRIGCEFCVIGSSYSAVARIWAVQGVGWEAQAATRAEQRRVARAAAQPSVCVFSCVVH
jgi:hypothetical protein